MMNRPLTLLAAALLLTVLTSCGGDQTAPSGNAETASAADAAKTTASNKQAAESAPLVAAEFRFPPKSEVPKLLSDEQLADGWISLFDGTTLFGWDHAGTANWRLENQTIVVDDGPQGLLWTTGQFGDYELSLQFQADAQTNSGIFLHTPMTGTRPADNCYELNIAPNDNPFPTGSLVQRVKVDSTLAKQAKSQVGADGWHTYLIRCQGDRVQVKWNGVPVVDYQDPQALRRGHIGLQKNQGRVAFRQIRLKPLGLQDQLAAADLANWKQYPEMASRFALNEQGELHVKGGRGQLESKDQWGDFILQLQCRTNAAGLNGGVFFRCIPGDEMMGYECQIHNGFKDGDRTQPEDCGSGGFFRRQHARLVAADDLTWFNLTLVADGPHMAAWVNGVQVSDWTDQRPTNENPRRGLRTAAGTIMIQGHDPTTDILFRGMQIEAIPSRNTPESAASAN